jgi:hypothetical protein
MYVALFEVIQRRRIFSKPVYLLDKGRIGAYRLPRFFPLYALNTRRKPGNVVAGCPFGYPVTTIPVLKKPKLLKNMIDL